MLRVWRCGDQVDGEDASEENGKWKVEGHGEEEGCDIVPEGEEVCAEESGKEKVGEEGCEKENEEVNESRDLRVPTFFVDDVVLSPSPALKQLHCVKVGDTICQANQTVA